MKTEQIDPKATVMRWLAFDAFVRDLKSAGLEPVRVIHDKQCIHLVVRQGAAFVGVAAAAIEPQCTLERHGYKYLSMNWINQGLYDLRILPA